MHGRPDYQGAWVDRTAAALQAQVTEDVIKSWTYRGWWDPETKKRRKLTVREDGKVLLGDVIAAERHTRRSGRSHRRLPPPSAYHKVA